MTVKLIYMFHSLFSVQMALSPKCLCFAISNSHSIVPCQGKHTSYLEDHRYLWNPLESLLHTEEFLSNSFVVKIMCHSHSVITTGPF